MPAQITKCPMTLCFSDAPGCTSCRFASQWHIIVRLSGDDNNCQAAGLPRLSTLPRAATLRDLLCESPFLYLSNVVSFLQANHSFLPSLILSAYI